VFLSFTNPPSTSGDPIIVSLDQGNNPSGTLTTTTVMTDSITGTNTVTGQTNQLVPLTDPDSMNQAPNGDLLLVSNADGDIVDVRNPGTSETVSFTPIQGVTAGNAGLDDAIRPSASAGTFFLSDTTDNRILSVHVTGLNTNDYYASVGSLKAFGQVDPTTGAFTPLVSATNAPGFSFGSPHGAEFVADAASSSPTVNSLTVFANAPTGSTAPDSVSIGGGFIWIAYTNGADGIPHRDLWLSPDHAVCSGGTLIPIKYLINQQTIVQEAWDSVVYFHVELAQHDVLFAESLPTESFLDTGNKSQFESGATITRPEPSSAPITWGAPGGSW
jgi:hypothetical protein